MVAIRTLADAAKIEQTPIEERLGAQNIHEVFRNNAERFGEAPALIHLPRGLAGDEPVVISHREHFQRINRTANLLTALGVGRTDVVSHLMPNVPETMYVLWGSEAVGIANPINYLLGSADIARILRAAQTRVLVAWGGGDGEILRRALEARAAAPCVEHLVVVGGVEGDGALVYEAMAAECDGLRLKAPGAAGGDVAAYFHTGGTTGEPKLASQSHRAQLIQAFVAGAPFGFGPGEVRLSGLPLFHVAAVMCGVLGPLTSGAATLFNGPSGYRDRKALRDTWRVIARYGITSMNSVPTVLAALLDVPLDGADVSSLRYVGGGAAPSSEAQTRAFEAHVGAPVVEGYGMTEAGALISCNPLCGERRAGSVGLRMPYVEVRVARSGDTPTSEACRVGEIGDVLIRGPGVTRGYKRAADNVGAFVDGWFRTGDCGRLDADGYLTLTGRSKDLIIRSGHNIDPSMVEEALRRHPAVELCSAVGYPDAYAGEVPAAFVRLREGAEAGAEELKAFARAQVAERPAAPAQVFIVDEIPVTAVGKLFKPPLRREAIARAFQVAAEAAAGGRCGVSVSVQEAAGEVTASVAVSGGTPELRRIVRGEVADVLGRFATSAAVRVEEEGATAPEGVLS